MAKSAYCSGCARRVDLTSEAECPQGHLRSMLRDVRQGVATPTPGVARSQPPSLQASETSRWQEVLAQLLGKSVVIVPVAAIVAFGLWSGYESVAGQGVSTFEAMLLSVGSLALTVGLAFAWAARRGGRR
jgi:hypothetical protein